MYTTVEEKRGSMPAKLSLITRETKEVIGFQGYPNALSDNHALDLNSPIPPAKYRRQKRWREKPGGTLLSLIQVEENTVLLVIGDIRYLGETRCLVAKGNDVVTANLQQIYVAYFQARYPGCQFWAAPGTRQGIIAVKHDGELVGLVASLEAI